MIFFDLDGPILDVSKRYYNIYRDILIENECSFLSENIYWLLKRNRVSERIILSIANPNLTFGIYNKLRSKRIEDETYLMLDCLQLEAAKILDCMSKNYSLILVTLRKSKLQLYKQLESLNIKKYFKDILVSGGSDGSERWQIKYNLIEKYLKSSSDNCHVIISDTETDIEVGKKLGFTTVAITNGIRTLDLLLKSNPDFIYSSIISFSCNFKFG